MDTKAVFWATALSAVIACIWIGVWANLPFALAPAMGLNAYFAFYVCNTLGLSWQNALACVAISGILFMFLSIFRVQQKIVDAMPECIKHSVGAGIGFFIAFTGFMQAGIIQESPDTLAHIRGFVKSGSVVSVIWYFFYSSSCDKKSTRSVVDRNTCSNGTRDCGEKSGDRNGIHRDTGNDFFF